MTCLQVEEWSLEEARVRRHRRMAMEAKQRAKETRGRVRITIPPLDGMPLLTMDDVRAIAAARFIDATPPFRPPVKLNGVMVEDVGTLDWAFFCKATQQPPKWMAHQTTSPLKQPKPLVSLLLAK